MPLYTRIRWGVNLGQRKERTHTLKDTFTAWTIAEITDPHLRGKHVPHGGSRYLLRTNVSRTPKCLNRGGKVNISIGDKEQVKMEHSDHVSTQGVCPPKNNQLLIATSKLAALRIQDKDVDTTLNTPLVHSDTGRGLLVTFLDITSKLFPSDIRETVSDEFNSQFVLTESIALADAATSTFKSISKWFCSFVHRKEREEIGFELAMEVCGLYEIILDRLVAAIKSTFSSCMVIQRAEDLELADRSLLSVTDANHSIGWCKLHSLLSELVATLNGTGAYGDVVSQLKRMLQEWDIGSREAHPLQQIEQFALYSQRLSEFLYASIPLVTNWIAREEKRQICVAEAYKKKLDEQHRNVTTLQQEKESQELAFQDALQSKGETIDRYIKKLEEALHREATLKKSMRVLEQQNAHNAGCMKESDEKLRTLECALRCREKEIVLMTEKHHREIEEHVSTLMRVTETNERLEKQSLQAEIVSRDTIRRHEQTITEKKIEIETLQNTLQNAEQNKSFLEHENVSLHKMQIDYVMEINALKEELELQRTTDAEKYNRILSMSRILEEFLGHKYTCDFQDTNKQIKADMCESLERIRQVLRTRCVTKLDSEDLIQSRTLLSKGDTGLALMFHEYESQIYETIDKLHNETEHMETVNNILKTPTKRKKITLQSNKKHRKVLTSDFSTRATENEHSSSSIVIEPTDRHKKGSTFEVDPEVNMSELPTLLIPEYITRNIRQEEELVLVALGHRPIYTLCQVLLLEHAPCEVKISEPGTCHCLQLKETAEELRCNLYVYWTPGGAFEAYKSDPTNKHCYAIVVQKEDCGTRSYFLVTVLSGRRECMYNFSSSPGSFSLANPKHFEFKHIFEPACHGPDHRIVCPTIPVSFLVTTQIVLCDDEVCKVEP